MSDNRKDRKMSWYIFRWMDGLLKLRENVTDKQGWSCKKRMVLQKNQGPGPAKKCVLQKWSFGGCGRWRLGGNALSLPASATQLSSFHGHPINFSKLPLCISNIIYYIFPIQFKVQTPDLFIIVSSPNTYLFNASQVPRPSCVEGRENEGHIACE